jgi:hypothetical protein
MSLSGFLPVASRRIVVMGSVAAFVCAVSGSVLRAQATAPPPQTTPPQTPAPAPPPDPLKFTTPAARLIVLSVSADCDVAFESALTMAKDVVAKPDTKPERKQQAAHWKVWKSTLPNGDVSLFFLLDSVVPNVSYNPFSILYDAGLPRDQIDALFARVNAGLKGLALFEYVPLIDMSGGGGGGH